MLSYAKLHALGLYYITQRN